MGEEQVLSVSLVVVATLEAIKWLVRYFLKNPTLNFRPKFYILVIPFLSFVWGWVFGLIGWADPIMLDWMYLLRWGLNIVLSLVLYQMGVKPLKDYIKEYNLKASEDAASKREII